MSDFIARRAQLSAQIKPGSIILLASAIEKYRNDGEPYTFHQDSNFHYLTNIDEPDTIAVISKDLDGDTKFIILIPQKHIKLTSILNEMRLITSDAN